MKTKRYYVRPVRYTDAQQQDAIRADLLCDAEQAEQQAINGPFYPDRDITAETLRAYAAECRANAAKRINVSAFIAGKPEAFDGLPDDSDPADPRTHSLSSRETHEANEGDIPRPDTPEDF